MEPVLTTRGQEEGLTQRNLTNSEDEAFDSDNQGGEDVSKGIKKFRKAVLKVRN